MTEFRRLIESARQRVPGLLYREETLGSPGTPVITTHAASGGTVFWNLLPDQALFESFVFVLQSFVSWATPTTSQEPALLQSHGESPPITVYLARWCPSSAAMASLVGTLALKLSDLRATMVDAEALPPEALPLGLSSVPMTLIGSSARLYGNCTEKELEAALAAESTGRGAGFTLGHMLDHRLGAEALELVRQRLCAVGALAGLVGGESLSLRLGTIYLLSQLAKEDRGLAGEGLPVLHSLLAHASPSIRGDALYALAEVGDLRSLPEVERLLSDPDEEVRAAAEEAREKIRSFNVWGSRM